MPGRKSADVAWKAILKRLLDGPATTDELKTIAGEHGDQVHFMLWNHWRADHVLSETGQLVDPTKPGYNDPQGPWSLGPNQHAEAKRITA